MSASSLDHTQLCLCQPGDCTRSHFLSMKLLRGQPGEEAPESLALVALSTCTGAKPWGLLPPTSSMPFPRWCIPQPCCIPTFSLRWVPGNVLCASVFVVFLVLIGCPGVALRVFDKPSSCTALETLAGMSSFSDASFPVWGSVGVVQIPKAERPSRSREPLVENVWEPLA